MCLNILTAAAPANTHYQTKRPNLCISLCFNHRCRQTSKRVAIQAYFCYLSREVKPMDMESRMENLVFMKGCDVLMTDPRTELEELCGLAHNQGYHPIKVEEWLHRDVEGSCAHSTPPHARSSDEDILFVDDNGDVFMTFPWLTFELVYMMARSKGYRSQPKSKWLRRNERGSPRLSNSGGISRHRPQSPTSAGVRGAEGSPSSRRVAGVAGGIQKPSRRLLFTHVPQRFFRGNELESFFKKYNVEPLSVRMIGQHFCESLRRAVVSLRSSEDSKTVMEEMASHFRFENIRVLEMDE
eukprot:TRINITY_DN40201_c0_g1_i1.p1 TRINITY_DN40201_c0_g1~~TRINITY_DN40201_c0_g1_i1.p1  ORF type:complete len:297 (-),score=34.80 TRINITY_DN40201_c0_g1_i1:140-1030(-)